MKRFLAIVQIVVVAFAALLMTSNGRAQDGTTSNYSQVQQVPRADIDKWLKDQVDKSHGKWDQDRYSFYIGFSTGGFGSDPVNAIAMKRLAFSLINNSLAPGDKITPVAFELTTSPIIDSITLNEDPGTRTQFVNSVPDSVRTNSEGGHDIDRALFDTLEKIPHDEYDSSIILLLNKDNTSQEGDKKASLFGYDNQQLQTAIAKGGFRTPPERKTFHMQSVDGKTQVVAITALFPKKLVSLPNSPGARYPTFALDTWQPTADKPGPSEVIPNSTSASPANPTLLQHTPIFPVIPHIEHHGIPWWKWLFLALVIVGAILFMVMGKRSGVQRPLQPVAATVAAPKIETVPGSLRVVIGPDEQTISPLIKGSTWTVSRQADGVVKLIDTSKPAAGQPVPVPASVAVPDPVPVPGTSLAKLSFTDDRTLHADADGGAQFAEMQGTAADKCDSRALLIEPGKRILCRVLPPDAASKTRFEIVYDTQVGKGSRV